MQTIPSALAGFDPAKIMAAVDKPSAKAWMNYAGNDEFFALWMALVDRRVVRRVGLGVLDLSDANYHDWYDDGVTPAQAAELAVHGNAEWSGGDWE